MVGDAAVAVHPEDPRYARFVGRRAVVPLQGGRTVPIIADEYVDREFGTGYVCIYIYIYIYILCVCVCVCV